MKNGQELPDVRVLKSPMKGGEEELFTLREKKNIKICGPREI